MNISWLSNFGQPMAGPPGAENHEPRHEYDADDGHAQDELLTIAPIAMEGPPPVWLFVVSAHAGRSKRLPSGGAGRSPDRNAASIRKPWNNIPRDRLQF